MENTFKPRCCGIWSVLSKEQRNFAEIINEFIDNARAAAATRITVHLVQTDTDEFSLEVTDDGYEWPGRILIRFLVLGLCEARWPIRDVEWA